VTGTPETVAAAGIVLAGGQSTRLGQDKALLRLPGGATLVSAVVGVLASVVDEVLVVSEDGSRLGLGTTRCVPDALRGAGALGGIYSGLAAAAHDRALVVACDMPFLNPALLRHLLIPREGCEAVLPRLASGLVEPLHAVYYRSCLGAIESQIRAGRHKVTSFLDLVAVCYVEEPELRRTDPDLRSFFNVNTREDLERALAILNERGQS
jgi:molybdopterin-guanine dinucleotide biosynthesis protein A